MGSGSSLLGDNFCLPLLGIFLMLIRFVIVAVEVGELPMTVAYMVLSMLVVGMTNGYLHSSVIIA